MILRYIQNYLIAIFILLCGLSLPLKAEGEIPQITIVYPKEDQVVGAVDSTFILGHIPKGLPYKNKDIYVAVNGYIVKVHRDGGFIAYVPVAPGDFVFDVIAFHKDQFPYVLLEQLSPLASAQRLVHIPEPLEELPGDTLQIKGDYKPPSGNLVLMEGDRLEVAFIGTPGLMAWFAVPGLADSVPMSEIPPRPQPYWGENVFGVGAIPESLLVKGIYTGFIDIPAQVSFEHVAVEYFLAVDKAAIIGQLLEGKPRELNIIDAFIKLNLPDLVTAQSHYEISVNPPGYPFTVKFVDSVQIIRHGPRKGYFSRFQPEGAEALVVGAEGDWYKLKLSETQYAWAFKDAVEPLSPGILPSHSYITTIRTYSEPDRTLIEFPLTGKHIFRINESDPRTLQLQLFGVTSNTDWIRYDFSDSLIDLITWSQPEPDLFETTVKLTKDIWGYDTYYYGNNIYLVLNKPPKETWRLKGKKIVLDPGHSQDPGAVGPTGYTEAEANLGIALMLRKMLKASGAEVIMTRDDNSNVALYDRPVVAKLNDADLFVSIHNNALPDGVNPFENYGVSTFYYNPHSADLAKAIQKHLLKITRQRDFGLYHGNLAVIRPPQYPAVLVECSFMILPEQEARLKTYKFRKELARAIVMGIEDFLDDYDHANN